MIIPIKDLKPVKIGNSHYFLIPAQYMKNGLIELDNKYKINVLPMKKT